ncbi:MAG TPA: glycosyltransferase family 4 protein [Candidatus Limnocylindrales bacterium]|nr:glycosyltransferase family 4 protein [Candidatus Limnocylindrales bacterium]
METDVPAETEAVPSADVARVVPQRLLLVLPTTAEFDSRTWRIAGAAVARGHTVTVLARSGPGLPDDELHPAGYRILRVPSRAVDGLPGRRLRRLAAPRPAPGSTDPKPSETPAAGRQAGGQPAGGQPGGDHPAGGDPGGDHPAPAVGGTGTTARIARLPVRIARRLAASLMRRAAIVLVIRAQRIGAERVAPDADVIHGMAYMGVPVALALRASGRAPRPSVVYDARDIYIDAANLARSPRWMRWLVGRAERRWARSADRVITVNQPYADVMARRWQLPTPLIVMNCSDPIEATDAPDGRFQRELGLPRDTLVVLYQGGFSRDRGIEQLITAIDAVPGATLVLMGYGVLGGWLREIEAGRADGRVRVMRAVPPSELLAWVGAADVVAMPIQPSTLNHRLTTPNKLFEALAAGVPVVASDLPGMAPIVRSTGAGEVVDPTDPTAIAAAIRSILERPAEERAALRRTAHRAADESYNWDAQVTKLFEAYGSLTGRPW